MFRRMDLILIMTKMVSLTNNMMTQILNFILYYELWPEYKKWRLLLRECIKLSRKLLKIGEFEYKLRGTPFFKI